MFLCESCIKDYYVKFDTGWVLWKPAFWENFIGPKSLGPCEDCKQTKICLDGPHGRYAHKNSEFAKEHILKIIRDEKHV